MLELLIILCIGVPMVVFLVAGLLSPFVAIDRAIRGTPKGELPGWAGFLIAVLGFAVCVLLFG